MKKRNLAIAVGGAAAAAVAVKMLTRAETVRWDDVASMVPHSDRSRFINVDGIRLHYQEFGDVSAPPLILIHGYTASAYVWKTSAPKLAESGCRVIAVDLVGFGYSEKPRWFDYSIQAQARIIARFMERLGIGRAVIVGSSYGGAVALNLALDYAEKAARLVLVDTVINDAPKRHPILRLAALPGVGEVITPFFVDSKAFLRLRMRGTLAPANHHLISDERIESIRRPLHAADAHHSVLATSRNWFADRIQQDAELITQPTLIIWGDQDSVIPIRHGYRLHRLMLNSRMVVIRDCGHVPQEEKSELFCELVTEFCRDAKGRISEPDERAELVA
ncbi:MAG: alpha/beta hydrolase [Acidobacteria bacterium]|nr:alpha/beta hydrolase [Acidobacteriota bacterium]MCW5948475.1 alpha/beta hydrolase [Pyrinomonadaceae bacterium]